MMRALTGYPLWFGLISAGIKLVDNRDRRIIRREDYGKPFAVHHGAREPAKRRAEILARIREIAPELIAEVESSANERAWPAWYRLAHTCGAAVSVTSIERCVVGQRTGEIRDAHTGEVVDLGPQRRWFFGPFGYVLAPPALLTNPVTCAGARGFWTLPGWAEYAVGKEMPA